MTIKPKLSCMHETFSQSQLTYLSNKKLSILIINGHNSYSHDLLI